MMPLMANDAVGKSEGRMADGIGRFLKGFFSKENARGAKNKAQTGPGWSQYQSEDGKVTQYILSFPPKSARPIDLSTVELPPEKFPILAMGSWCVGLCCVNEEKFLMFKADGFVEEIEKCGLTVGIAFCKMPSQGFMRADIRVESEELRSKVTLKYEHVPLLDKPVGGWLSALSSMDMELIPAILSGEEFRVVLTRSETFSRSSILLPDGTVMQARMPVCVCEFAFAMSQELRALMVKSWSDLVGYDDSITAYERNYRIAAATELPKYFPPDKDPILCEP
jgi:hypothetical protein